MGIRKVKTWHGLRWGVTKANGDIVEYKDFSDGYKKLALFPYTPEGLEKAKKLRYSFN